MELAALLPIELVREIYTWIRLFDQRDAVDRVTLFQQTYGQEWDALMVTVRTNVPRYTFVLLTRSGRPLRTSVYSPDCNPEIWPGYQQNNRVVLSRRVASIQEDFLRTSGLMGSSEL